MVRLHGFVYVSGSPGGVAHYATKDLEKMQKTGLSSRLFRTNRELEVVALEVPAQFSPMVGLSDGFTSGRYLAGPSRSRSMTQGRNSGNPK